MIDVEAASRPGKTAPRLLEDLIVYDPAKSKRDILAEDAPQFTPSKPLPARTSSGSCRHKFMDKTDQCIIPPLDWRPEAGDFYRVASFCQECRCHLNLTIQYRGGRPGEAPCPNGKFPLHHFRSIPHKTKPRRKSVGYIVRENWQEERCFGCSSPICSAEVTVTLSSPRLTPEYVSLLTDKERIAERLKRVSDSEPERSFESALEPWEVLSRLKTYVGDALRPSPRRQISARNKKFVTALGEDCRNILESLGFTLDEAAEIWNLPEVDPSSATPFQDHQKIILDDVEKELMVLMSKRPWHEFQQKTSIHFRPVPSIKSFQRVLGCLDYDKRSSMRRPIDLTQEEHPYYASLGALADFSDSLLGFAYDRQRCTDPNNAPYYFECLQNLAKARDSEQLNTKVAVLESQGEFSNADVRRAYEYFGIQPDTPNMEDDYIIGTFQARVSDAPRQQAEMRQQLRIIGEARRSDKIKDVASNTVTNYEQALTWLSAQEGTPDDFIVSAAVVKHNESPADERTAREAVRIIGEHRNSRALKNWLSTGQMEVQEMDLGMAYNRLGIDDRTLDDDTILTTFSLRVEDEPSQLDDLRAALKAIGKHSKSHRIESFLNTGKMIADFSPDWPVGLENIGNTCYLNSLLQFYFTVAPLRAMVLNFDEFRMDLSSENVERKKVGSRKVTRKEIERAQKFAYELQKLFRSLISARATSITPEYELARLTLISSMNEEHYRRMSIASINGPPNLGEINGAPVYGPVGPPQPSIEMDVDVKPEPEPEKRLETIHSDAGSETTLIGDVSEKPHAYENGCDILVDGNDNGSHGQIQGDKENYPPNSGNPSDPTLTIEVVDGMAIDSNEDEQVNGVVMLPKGDTQSSPPERPAPIPPLPPRPKPADTQKLRGELEMGAQQDVTEVIANVLFQLECAIKPIGFEDDGEQIDIVKELFYGTINSYIKKPGEAIRVKKQLFADIKVNVAAGPCDIYSALNGAFDEQQIEIDGTTARQYDSISRNPPILQIHIQRAQYDQAQKTTFKANSHLSLEKMIFLDRYMDSDDPTLMEEREKSWLWKEELARLESSKANWMKTEANVDVETMYNLTTDWLETVQSAPEWGQDEPLAVEPGVVEALRERAKAAKKELEEIDASIRAIQSELRNQYADRHQLGYRLHSVFIHRGTVSFGHYWIYIYDFQRNVWRKYNDGYVSEVADEREIFEQEKSNPATPYFLVYVQDEFKDILVDAVCRKVDDGNVDGTPGASDQMDW